MARVPKLYPAVLAAVTVLAIVAVLNRYHSSGTLWTLPVSVGSIDSNNSSSYQASENENLLGGHSSDTKAVVKISPTKIHKTPGYSQVDTVLGLALEAMSKVSLENTYFSIAEQQHITCPNSVRIGDTTDGGWDVCFIKPYSILDSKPCVTFSFGINNIWRYDDLLAEKYECKVYMFDPSMTTVNDHQRKSTSWFYRTGLSSENKVEVNGWKMRTLCTLFKDLGYANKTVDILKFDVEHWEWVSLEKAMQEGCLSNVKQLLFESHTSELIGQRSDYARFIRIWRGLFQLGFRTWKWHKNPSSIVYNSMEPPHSSRACCYEHYMLNTRFIRL